MLQMNALIIILSCSCLVVYQSCDTPEPEKTSLQETERDKSFDNAYISEIVPLADGGAYAFGLLGSVWHLQGAEAVKVKEVAQLTTQPASSLKTKKEKALWAMWTRELSKRKRLQEELQDLE